MTKKSAPEGALEDVAAGRCRRDVSADQFNTLCAMAV